MPKSTRWGHPYGISIHYYTTIGENCFILQNVTLGRRYANHDVPNDYPKVGDDVTLCCGAIVLGDVTIGNGAVIAAGSIVLKDVPPDATVVGIWK
jgi:serine O-acetyltransferase